MIIKTILVRFLQDLQLMPPKYKGYVGCACLLLFFNMVLNKRTAWLPVKLLLAGNNRCLTQTGRNTKEEG